MIDDLHVRYRPTLLSEVVGHGSVVRQLGAMVEKESVPHSFLFSGPAGVGKTTLARILATDVIAGSVETVEVDAATNSKVEQTRALFSNLYYKPIGYDARLYIIDECHALSSSSWQALLKILEEPPDHIYFALCTTELDKVPQTIRSRCHAYALKPLKQDEVVDLLEWVVDVEDGLEVSKEVISAIARESQGSPRRALVGLSKAQHCKTKEEVAELMEDLEEGSSVIELCRFLIRNPGTAQWPKAVELIKNLDYDSNESARLQIVAYFTAAVLGSKSPDERFLRALDAFARKPYIYAERSAPIILTVAELLLNEGG